MTTDTTQKAILDAAEELLGEVGFAAMSLRALTARAGVNLAAVNYHFGTKEELAKAVLRRRVDPVTRARFAGLDALEQAAADSGGPPAARGVIRAFLAPVLGLAEADGGTRACGMFGRLLAEMPPFLREWMIGQFRETAARFGRALQRAVPDVPAEEVFWRLHFLVGSMTHTLLHGPMLGALSGGLCDADDTEGILERLITFGLAGVTSPATSLRTGNTP